MEEFREVLPAFSAYASENHWAWLYAIVATIVLVGIGFLTKRFLSERLLHGTKERANGLVKEAEREIDNAKKLARLDTKNERYEMRKEFDRETQKRREEIRVLSEKLDRREANLDKKVDALEKKDVRIGVREKEVSDKQRAINSLEQELSKQLDGHKRRLEELSGMTQAEAKREFAAVLESEVKRECAHKLKRLEDETRETADKKSRWILTEAIQRCAAEHVVESTVSVVALPNDEMKGRIIGREGRNIRAFESASGIDIIVDDTPEAIILSGYDPVRREIARIAMERLISDGRIHPGRIEELVAKVTEEMEVKLKEAGEQAALETDVHGLHPEEIKLIGRLKYRTSYGQNVLQHSKEVAYISSVMASELGVNVRTAKRAGFLHDIGKAVSHEVEGSHAVIGGDLARKYGETDEIVNSIASHHGDVEAQSIIACLTQAADAVSAARPGARRETIDLYVKRLEKLENIAESFPGVEKTFAIQAGREIRVVVEPDKVTDSDSYMLARDISKKIEAELQYPGQIKITVIRETRVVDYAR